MYSHSKKKFYKNSAIFENVKYFQKAVYLWITLSLKEVAFCIVLTFIQASFADNVLTMERVCVRVCCKHDTLYTGTPLAWTPLFCSGKVFLPVLTLNHQAVIILFPETRNSLSKWKARQYLHWGGAPKMQPDMVKSLTD